jgi:hypothetical protein
MSEAISIKRRKSTDSDTSFEALKSEAIKLVEQISGQVWTDYNLHDPGITILEQLNFAITDLIYRTEFPIEDYLTNEDGIIDFDHQALHTPIEVFPCRPTTMLDYRKVFLDGVSDVENIWLTPVDALQQENEYKGLYNISVKLEHGLDEKSRASALHKIRKIYNGSRNLCEDVAEIRVVDDLDYELCANIEVSSARRPVDILAEIYFECSRRIAGSVSITDYSKLVNQVGSLDELFTGPFTSHGFFLDSDFSDKQSEFLVSTLFYIINSIDGVDHIQQLCLEKDNERFYDAIVSDGADQAFCLLIPRTTKDIKVVLSTNGRVLPISIDEVRARYDEISFKYHSSRSTPQLLSYIYDLPQGVSRPLDHYSTIQNQFPVTYGINRFGLPESAPTELKAKARQLKSYLVIFEQLLTNYLANLNSVKTLFSLEREQRGSYSIKLPDQQQIADLDSIYPENPFDVFKRIMSNFDDYHDRKSRLLDYLLALYGESFAQNTLRHFNYYYSSDEVKNVIVNNKIDYLQSIIQLGRDRAAAPDYSAPSWNKRAQSGLQLRVGMLLGFEQHAARSLTMAIFKQGIRLTRHSVYEELKAGSHEFKFVDMDDLDKPSRDSFENVPAYAYEADISLHELRQKIGDAIPLKNNMLSDMLLRGGIYNDRYRVGSLTSGQDYQLTFITGENQYWYLGTYADKETAVQAANSLRHFLILLNKESEGLHIVEHILLRPEGSDSYAEMSSRQQREFFSLKISVIFPAWTARCCDKQFRMLAEERVQLNAPAHVYPEIYWLEFHKMYEFEILYEKWLELKSDEESDMAELNDCAQKLIKFLINNRNGHENSG